MAKKSLAGALSPPQRNASPGLDNISAESDSRLPPSANPKSGWSWQGRHQRGPQAAGHVPKALPAVRTQ